MPLRSEVLLQHFAQLHPKTIDLSLGRMARLLKALGTPQTRLPPAIHIAGTNGKGSVLAYLQAIWQADNQRVHSYSSPHLVRFHERIQLHGKPISETALTEALRQCQRVNADKPITFFEATTAAAFHAFAHSPADILLLEVGLGGRLDATNGATNIASSVITTIGYDHTEYLGAQLGAIAKEKAGIIRRGVPVMLGRINRPQRALIEAIAQKHNAPVQRLGQAFSYRRHKKDWIFCDGNGTQSLPHPALAGAYQYDNAALAVAVARQFGRTDHAIAQGLIQAHWPARLQSLPMPQWPNLQIWLDGGHNALAGRALAQWARQAKSAPPLYLISAMLNTKDAPSFFAPFAPLAKHSFTVALPDSPNGYAPQALARYARAAGVRTSVATNVSDALNRISQKAPTARVLICGSLYLSGQVLRDFLPARI